MNIARQFGVTQKGGDPKLKQPLLRNADVTPPRNKPVTDRNAVTRNVTRNEPITDDVTRVTALEGTVNMLTAYLERLEERVRALEGKPPIPFSAEPKLMTNAERQAAYRARKRNAPC